MRRVCNITIIGGGFSGTALAIQLLLKNKHIPLSIKIVEKGAQFGRGPAYSTEKNYHLLNVKAENMSALPDKPDDFTNWLHEKNIPLSPSGHMPRKIYGDYLNELLQSTLEYESTTNTEFEIIRDEAIDIDLINEKARVYLKNRKYIDSDKVILALGNFPPATLPFIDGSIISKRKYCEDPWSCKSLQRIKSNDTVLIIGTGLTMIDTCISLFENNHKGKIISISRHGYLPLVHNYTEPYPPFHEDLKEYSILEILKVIKKHISEAKEKGINFRSVIDSLRPFTQELWIQLPAKEKGIFLTRLNRIWNVARHRIPPEYQQTIHSLQEAQQLEIISGKLVKVEADKDQMEVEFIRNKIVEKIKVDFVINCTGPQSNYKKVNHPLVKNLLEKEIIKPGPFNMGIEAYPDGRIISNPRSTIFYTLGPPLVGVLFETTAVPELRKQAKKLAARLIYDLKRSPKKV